MVRFVPEADSLAGRVLTRLGRLLGLRSETVYSRALLVLTLLLLGLGCAVSAGVWLAMFRQFDLAGEEELRSAAGRAREFLVAQSGEGAAAPDAGALQQVTLILGRNVTFRPATDASGLLSLPAHGQAPVSLPWTDGSGRVIGSIEVEGGSPFNRPGEIAARLFLLGLTVAGGVTLLLIFIVLDRTILGRIQRLAEKVEHEKDSERLPVKLDFPGDDELAQLASSIEELASLVQAAEREYRNVVEDQTESVCRFDENNRILVHNRAFEDLCVSPPRGLRPSMEACLDPETMRLVSDTMERLTASAPVSSFTHAMTRDNSFSVWYRSTLRANFHGDGRSAGGQWIAVDVTPEVSARRRLQESQRELRVLSGRLMNLQDEERRRIARELHDSTAQSLSALEMNTSVLESLADGEHARKVAAETRAISRQVCLELRNISYLLHPPLLEEQGLAFAIRWFSEGFTSRNGIPVALDIPVDFNRLDPVVETALFRIVQEALSNIYRHAGATKAWITLRSSESEGVFLEIRDNGEGLPDNQLPGQSSGVGLAGMRERMNHLGGALEVDSSPYGVSVKCRLAFNSSHADVLEEEA
ncbi:MAG: hypothetical protein IAE97_14840 [Chthoniobacterales bacterium]|nr:hypothetical protein [Chthoniobacterales bacterium]